MERNVSASVQTQTLSVLLFLGKKVLELGGLWLDDLVRGGKPVHLPRVMTQQETMALLAKAGDPK